MLAPPPPAAGAPTRLRAASPPLAVAAVLVVVLLVLGAAYHPFPAAGAENDGYVYRAEGILAGRLPHDPFRPDLYPLLVAGFGWLLGDCFVAARVVTSLAAGLLVLASYGLARVCFGRRAALLSAILVAVHPSVLVLGVQAITDVLFAALAVATLGFAASGVQRTRRRTVVLTALCFALSYFTRYTATALLAPVLLALLWPGPGLRGRAVRLLTFGGCTLVFLLPHFVLNQIQFGVPWHDEAWRSIALKYFGGMDWGYLRAMPFDSPLAVLTHDPGRILAEGGEDLRRYLRFGLGRQLAGGSGTSVPLAFALLGIALAVLARNRRVAVGIVFTAAYATALCLAFLPLERFTLPIVAFLLGAAASFATRVARLPGVPGWVARGASLALAGALLVAIVQPIPERLRRFAARHPTRELAAIQNLAEQLGPVGILSSYSYVQRYVEAPARAHRLVLLGRGSVEDNVSRIEEAARRTRSQLVVLGPATVRELWEPLANAHYTGALRILEREPDLLVLTAADELGEAIRRARVCPTPYRRGALRVEIDLGAGARTDDIVAAGATLIDPSDRALRVPLARRSPTAFAISVAPPAPLLPGRYTVFPWIRTAQGRFGRAHPFPWEVRAR